MVHLRVKLLLSPGGVRIPIEPERNFVGRDQEITKLEKALAPDGARVLVHGIAGVGKDTLVAETLRGSDVVKALPGVHMMAWLQGSTDAALRRQLINHFLTHQHTLLRGLEQDPKACLKAIYRWLRGNGGWLFVVEDGTTQCRALFECLPLDAPHGRVVVTSKERLDRSPDLTGGGREAVGSVFSCYVLSDGVVGKYTPTTMLHACTDRLRVCYDNTWKPFLTL